MKKYAGRETLRDRILQILAKHPHRWFDTTQLAKEVRELGDENRLPVLVIRIGTVAKELRDNELVEHRSVPRHPLYGKGTRFEYQHKEGANT